MVELEFSGLKSGPIANTVPFSSNASTHRYTYMYLLTHPHALTPSLSLSLTDHIHQAAVDRGANSSY